MRKCILLFTIATLLAASFCSSDASFYSSDDIIFSDSGCSLDEDEPTKDVCNKRNATASGYDCCLLSGTFEGKKTVSCVAAMKSKAGKIVDKLKEEADETTKDIKLQCESSMIKYFTLFSLLSLFLF